MAIEIGEYTGDASGAGRVITPGGTIRNLAAVFVFHLTGGNWYHYLRVREQPAANTDSVALVAIEDETGVFGRQNKITAMDATTFTVGSDLNVDGDDYWFFCFDYELGFVATGQYTGQGGVHHRNSTITMGAGPAAAFSIPAPVTGQGAFNTTGSVGKVIETNENYVLGEGIEVLTVLTANPSGSGTQTGTMAAFASAFPAATTIIGTQWRLRARRIPLPFAPDLFFVFRTRTTGDGVLGTGTIGQLGWWHRASLANSAQNARMDSPGSISTLPNMHLIPNEAAFHVKTDQREDDAANQGPNIEGETYFWLAIRAGGPNFMRRISYVGNGDANPVHLHGGDFDPLLALIGNDLSTFAEARIYPSGISSVAAGRSLNFAPGGGVETDMLMTYHSTGVHMAGGLTMNVNNALYAGLLIRSGHRYDQGANLTLYMSHPYDINPNLRLSHPDDVGAIKLSHPNDIGDNLRTVRRTGET